MLAGSAHHFLPNFPTAIGGVGLDRFDAFLRDGVQRAIPPAHPCRLFIWSDVQSLMEDSGAEMLGASSSNWLSLAPESVLDKLRAVPALRDKFLDWEEWFCAQPGARDGGTHILFAARKAPSGIQRS